MSSKQTINVDPVLLGRAGLNALALAGAAIVAHYSTGRAGPESLMPAEVGDVLSRAIAAFKGTDSDGVPSQRDAEAVAAMLEHAQSSAARAERLRTLPTRMA